MIGKVMIGTIYSDELRGGSGDDDIYGGAGVDYLSGGDGNDFILGGADIDYINGDAGDDRLFGGEGNDSITGGFGADIPSGDDGDDYLIGSDGNFSDTSFDRLLGGAGNDTLWSISPGLLDGGSGIDTASINRTNSAIGLKIDFTSPDRVQTLADGTIITGIEIAGFAGGNGNDVIQGGNYGNVLYGGGGSDQLWGGAGIDVIGGGAGKDRLVGGGGADVFTFSYGDNRDRIIDFVQGEDKIDLWHFTYATFDKVLAATSRDATTGMVTIDMSQFGGAPKDAIEILTDPSKPFAFTAADFSLFSWWT
jgi:Ca2+-binding RTX toxin-like protein